MIAKRHVVYAVSALSVGAVAFLSFSILPLSSPDFNHDDPKVLNSSPQQLKKTFVHLYFSDKDNSFLISEQRTLSQLEHPADFAKSIMQALIKGPQQGLVPTIPAETTIRALHVTQEGICYVDLSATVAEKHPGGVKSELLTIYSIVNSLILNVPEIETVKILIGGKESMTLAGHIDLQFPVKANMLLIR